MIKQYKDGGLQAIDFDYINGTLKINWLKSFLNNPKLWFHIPRVIQEIRRNIVSVKL